MKKIIPIFIIMLLTMVSCHRSKGVYKSTKNTQCDTVVVDDYVSWNDSFIVVYRQPVNGYNVKAVIKPETDDVTILKADFSFEKNGKAFILHTTCFGDTIFCKGRMDNESYNINQFKKYKKQIVKTNYKVNSYGNRVMPMYTPFFFRDLDFDGIKELVVVHYTMAVRYHNGYDVYRIVDGKPFQIDYPPYKNGGDDDFGMTDYPEFDYKKKEITCVIPEGSVGEDGIIITYGISKRKKDIVNVNGRKHYFNHIEKIKEIKFDD